MLERFKAMLSADEWQQFTSLKQPQDIQLFLDQTPYNPDYRNRSVVNVLRDRIAHCLDGAIFAAAALSQLNFPPVIIDLLPAPEQDDDHVLAIYKQGGNYGAVAKSNFAGLRSRQPVYNSIRELVMSYFEWFYNINGMRTLRGYTRPINLERYLEKDWLVSDTGIDFIEMRLKNLKVTPLFNDQVASRLSPMDKLSYEAGMLGVNFDGLYKPLTNSSGRA
jgi:hypothetical protein